MTYENKPHWSFWLIGIVALTWNLLGVANFVWQMTPDALASYPKAERAIIENRPLWATLGFGLAVIAGSLGCLLLLLRKSAANGFFAATLIGVIVTVLHTLIAVGIGPSGAIVPVAMVLGVAIFLIWYARRTGRYGWLS
ncbi:MAG: hypothetical protein K8F59_02205 [Rhodobacteraceae bacterium]|nr:hypothetical protein [Paracoccaceae bacterium]